MKTSFVVPAGVYVLGLLGRCVYEVLKKAKRVDPARRLIFAVVFADMAALWASWFAMAEQDPCRLGAPPALRWAGLGLTVLGAVLFVGALMQLRALENTKVLVTGGLFALTRHPIYLGFLLWFGAWPLYHDAALSLGLGLLGMAATLFWRHNEERALTEQFGDAYRAYQKRTWF